MSKTYRPKQSLVRTYAVGLAFFLIVGTASVAFFLFNPEIRGAEGRIAVAAVVGLFWSFFAAGSTYGIVAVRSSRLTASEDGLTETTPLGESTVRYQDVREVRWGTMRRNTVELRGKTGKGRDAKLEIDLEAYERRAALDLIRRLRAKLPHAEHVGWERFCRQYAIPLRDIVNGVVRSPRPDERRLMRRRWDLIFAPSIVLCGIAAGGVASATGDAHPFVVLLPVAAMWALVRFSWPREGAVVRRTAPQNGRWLMIVLGASALLVGVLATAAAIPSLDLPQIVERFSGAWAFGAFLAWLSVVGWAVVRTGEAQKERETLESLGAAEEWEEGEQIVFVDD